LYLEIIALTSAIVSPIATYFIGKRLINQAGNNMIDNIFDVIESEDAKNILQNFINQESTQKFFYEVGGLIGSGARAGIGIQKRGGKMGLKDLIISIAANYMGLPQMNNEGIIPQQPIKERNNNRRMGEI